MYVKSEVTGTTKVLHVLAFGSILWITSYLSAWPEVRGTTDTDGGAYSPFRSILLVLTHDFIIIQVYGPTGGDG